MHGRFRRLIDGFFEGTPPEPFAIRARARFFVALMLVSVPLLAVVVFLELVRGHLASLPLELGILAFVGVLLGLVRFHRMSLALNLYSLGLPALFLGRYLSAVLGVDSNRDLLFSDYLLGYATLNLVMIALTSSQRRHLLVASSLYLTAGAANAVWLLGPANPGRSAELYGVVLFRYALLLGFLTVLLVLLQGIIQRATRQSVDSEKRLESLVQERTADLKAAQESLDQARSVLTAGEKSALLGRLAAGVAHEVNTPLAAIQASQGHLQEQVPAILEGWVRLAPRLSSETLVLLMEVVSRAESEVERLDSRQTREQRRRFAGWLNDRGVDASGTTAETLAEWGLADLEERWLPLFLSDDSEELLLRAGELIDLKRSVSIIGAAADKVGTSVDTLRRFEGTKPADRPPKPVDLGRSLETVLALYRSQVGPGVDLRTELPSDGPWVLAQGDRLLQVWANLVLNAAQALKGSGELVLSAAVDGPWAEVRVRDNGPGIPPDLQAKLLEPFVSTKASGDGLGLGLEIVRTIVEDHGGTVSFESRPGRTEFLVRLNAVFPERGESHQQGREGFHGR